MTRDTQTWEKQHKRIRPQNNHIKTDQKSARINWTTTRHAIDHGCHANNLIESLYFNNVQFKTLVRFKKQNNYKN